MCRGTCTAGGIVSHMEPQPTRESYITQAGVSPVKNTSRSNVVFAFFVGLPAVLFWFAATVTVLGIMAVASDSRNKVECNVAVVPVHGVITSDDEGFTRLLGFGIISGARTLIRQVNEALHDESILAILVDIDSPGGTPVAADDVMQALHESEKPTVALVRDVGASAAYWLAAGADHIVASPISNIGSIGVTMSYMEEAGAHEEEGMRWINLSSGPFKDAGHPDRRISEGEQEYFQEQVDDVHTYMIERIALARPTRTYDEYLELADGRTYLGAKGLELGLVDTLGGMREVRQYLADTLDLTTDEIRICEPKRGGLRSLLE
jgi:protease IV